MLRQHPGYRAAKRSGHWLPWYTGNQTTSTAEMGGGAVTPRVYLETTVVSYLAARPSRDLIIAANQQVTHEWWLARRASFEVYISQLVVNEAETGDEKAVQRRLQIIDGIPLLALTQDVLVLTERLVAHGAIPTAASEDALHVAIATANGMDYLLTWNFRHIANATMRSRIEYVCRYAGFEPPVICSPQELLEEWES